MTKPEHFKTQLNCLYCVHYLKVNYGDTCSKHDFYLDNYETLHGFCNDFERDEK